MSHTSPASFLVWALASCLLGAFLLFHLWSFDRFKCLKWNNGPYSGAFKRVMTYSYLLSVPLIMIYAVGNAVIKYREGFVAIAFVGVVPKPYILWDQSSRDAIFPLTLMFSFAWSLEMVTHLEELCFWLFLVNSGSAQQDWFRSLYFKTWITGSSIAILYLPFVTIFTRSQPLKCEAYTFLAGSLGSLCLTLWFLPVLWTFPSFLQGLKSEGVDTATIVRLTKFSELNLIRVVFRFLFTVPLLILGADGVTPHTHINESMMWTDLLCMISAFGVAISSAITLVIFFPRSVEGEIAAKEAAKERKYGRSFARTSSFFESNIHSPISQAYLEPPGSTTGHYLLTTTPSKGKAFDMQSFDSQLPTESASRLESNITPFDKNNWATLDDEERDIPAALPPIRPNRRRGRDVELGGIEGLTESNLSVHNTRLSNVNPLVHNFTSPIDLAHGTQTGNESRLTFSRH